jgi:hypothetical protein
MSTESIEATSLAFRRSSGALARRVRPSLRTGFLGGSGEEMRVAGFVSRCIQIDTGKSCSVS